MVEWPQHVPLEGKYASLVPLEITHAEALAEASADGDLASLWHTSVPAPEDVLAEVKRRRALKTMRAFAVLEPSSGCAVGMTSYMNIDPENKRVEIGSTWYRKSVQRTPINTECKLMLLTHAFDVLACNAVEFRTHILNRQSRTAIERLGAKQDGILRNHMVMLNGSLRDTVVYSILPHEWQTIKAHLTHKLS